MLCQHHSGRFVAEGEMEVAEFQMFVAQFKDIFQHIGQGLIAHSFGGRSASAQRRRRVGESLLEGPVQCPGGYANSIHVVMIHVCRTRGGAIQKIQLPGGELDNFGIFVSRLDRRDFGEDRLERLARVEVRRKHDLR